MGVCELHNAKKYPVGSGVAPRARQQESKMLCVLTVVTVLPLFTPLPHSCLPSLCKRGLFGVMNGSYHQSTKQIAVLGLVSTHPKKIAWLQGCRVDVNLGFLFGEVGVMKNIFA